jgi:hypothetical protein
VLATAHDQFKDAALWADLSLVVDTRNMIAPLFKDGTNGPRRLVRA